MDVIVGEYYGPPPPAYARAQAALNRIMSTPPTAPIRSAYDWHLHRLRIHHAAEPWFRLMADIPWPPPGIVWRDNMAFLVPRA